ncbi:MAG TPA: DUF4336 domain-containing protein [Crenotrichaceae bacterium]|nr:DUF4336 domain-containing protein [Crenotrichaceae bacterium]
MQLKKFDDNIWICDGKTVNFYGFPYSTRMTVIQLSQGDLWVHSPVELNEQLKKELDKLGKVVFLISPNKIHHLFLSEWVSAYSDANCYASPGLASKRQDIHFTKELTLQPEKEWVNEIEQTIFLGSPAMEEVVFFHISSKTLILADLIENFNPTAFNCWQKKIARVVGILSPNGKTPVDWRISFFLGKKKAQKALDIMLGWKPENIIISHGECILGNAPEFLEKSFGWVS